MGLALYLAQILEKAIDELRYLWIRIE